MDKLTREKTKAFFMEFLKNSNATQEAAAGILGISQSALANKLSRGSLKLEEFLLLCAMFGKRPIVVPKDATVEVTYNITRHNQMMGTAPFGGGFPRKQTIKETLKDE